MQKTTLVAAAAALMLIGPARAENGVFANRIVFGQAAALDGPSAALGNGMRVGLLTAFAEANRAGGVHGLALALVSRNDGYEPDRSTQAARQLIDKDHVFALAGFVGTPTAVAVEPIAEQAGVPFIGAFTGAEFLRRPYKPGVVNVRASYFQETEAIVDRLTRLGGVTRIAAFFQDDAFGRAGLAGVKRALGKRQMSLVSEGSYARNTVLVEDAVAAIGPARPQTVIIIGTYKPAAAFIRAARRGGMAAQFFSISFVGADALAKELGQEGAGVMVSEVMPSPGNAAIPVVAAYRAALKTGFPAEKPGYVSLEGYVVGRLVAAALGRVSGPVTRAGLLDAITASGGFDLGGLRVTYGPDNNRGSDTVFFTRLPGDGSVAEAGGQP